LSSVPERRGLGRGLEVLLGGATATELTELPVDAIHPNPRQPRRKFDSDAGAGLAESVRAQGVVQPVLVRPRAEGGYELIAGERRWRAAQQAGLEKVPAIVRDSERAERLQVALIENVVREDLNPIDEARACAALVEDLGLSKEELARRIGRSRPAVSNLIRLLELPDEALALLESGELTEGHGKALLGIRGNDARRRLARDAANGGWSVRETENRIKLASQPNRRPRPKPVDAERQAALRDVGDELESSIGHEVRVRPRGEEIVVEIHLSDLSETLELARRLGRQKD
jgi:ParB family transcriptional regulator, chromosome partitioning protein